MQHVLFKKALVSGIILLFIGLIILPVIKGNDYNGFSIDFINKNEIEENHNIASKFSIISHPAQKNEIDQLKSLYGIFDKRREYNVVYDGYGTGLAPPTEKDYELMAGSLLFIDKIISPMPVFDSYDLSADSCFPIVGNQASQGSCAAWAATYYANGFIQAKNNNWNRASSGDPTQLLSPAWTFNKCNDGTSGSGSFPAANGFIMRDVGACRWNQMPYDDSDYISWGNESAWRDAPLYRINQVYEFEYPYDNSDINLIKNLISSGTPVTFCLNASSYSFFGSDDVLNSSVMLNDLDHVNTIVGFDNTKKDNDSEETGAFKVVNSWGNWGPNNNGYYWITYEAFLGAWNIGPVNVFVDRYINTTPSLLAVWHLNPTVDRDADINISIRSNNNLLDSKEPLWDGYSQFLHPFPSFMCIDITEFYEEWISNASDFYLSVGNTSGNNGTITSFKIEHHSINYTADNPSRTSIESPDTPKKTPGSAMVTFPRYVPIVYVDDDYSNITSGWQVIRFNSIQDGVNAVDEYGTVYVLNGTYLEEFMSPENSYVYINKSINLVGENKTTTILNCPHPVTFDYFGIRIGYNGIVDVNDVLISGFSVNGSNHPQSIGINIQTNSTNITIDDCVTHSFSEGISVRTDCFNIKISNCTSYDNAPGGGICFQEGGGNFEVFGCTLYSNSYGIFILNVFTGIDYLIYHNNFHNNTVNVYDTGTSHYWFNTLLEQGNYYDDYTGYDNNGDGIGDTPYTIAGGSNQDLYPLMSPYGPPHADYIVFIDDLTIFCNASISYDYDGYILSYKWDFGDDTYSTGMVITHTYADFGSYNVVLTVRDDDGKNDTATKIISINSPPVFGPLNPANGSTNQSLNIMWDILITDPESNPFSWTIECSNGQKHSGTNETNGTKTLPLSGLAYFKTYKVWVNATDPAGSNKFTRRWYTFTTKEQNTPPSFNSPNPVNGTGNQPVNLIWSIPINDPQGDLFSWNIQCSNGQSNSSTGAMNGTKTLALSGLAYATMYMVWVNATDPTGSGLYTRKWYTFTTKASLPPVFGVPSPVNGTGNQPLGFTWSIPINDPEGDLFSWTIQCSNGQSNSGTDETNGFKSLALSGLMYSTIYKVWVNATDPFGSGQYTRRWYTFTTKASLPPVFGVPSPVNGTGNQPLGFTWSIPINDPEGDLFSWAIQCSNGQVSSGTGASNGTKSLSLSGLTYSTMYKVWVNTTDPEGSGIYTRKWYSFTTKANLPPTFGNPIPRNGSTNQPLSFTWKIPINDLEGDIFSWTIECSNGQNNNSNEATNGTKTLLLTGLSYSTTYMIWVNATDPTGSNKFSRRWYKIVTQSGNAGGGGGGGGVAPPPSGPENKKPIANASAGEPYQGHVNSEITFDGSNSYDPDGNITKWYWLFGDNTNGTGKIIKHTYLKTGTYNVTLTVTDNQKATNTTTISVMIIQQPNRPPTKPTVTGPTTGTTNTTYTYTVLATDPDNDTIRYSIVWGDGVSSGNSSTFLPSGTTFIFSYHWTTPGQYIVMVSVSDNQTGSFSQITVNIEVEKKETSSTPGFELIFIIGAISVSILLLRKKNF